VVGVRIGVKPGQWGWTFAELEESWRLAEEVGFDVLACFDHVTASPQERRAWDGPSLLAAMAGRTDRIRLAIHVVNTSLRNPFLLAATLAVAQASSRGRLEVGIGAGSYHFARYDNAAIGVAFGSYRERMERLRACCRILPALWRGEHVTDTTVGVVDASLGPIGIDPPKLFVGGSSESALRLAAQHADGWHSPDEDGFPERSNRLDELSAELGRPTVEKSIQLWPTEFDGLRDRIALLGEAGASTVIFVLDVDQRGRAWVGRLADAVL
jgi:alkanesulfonate monooxygenase SsuD/methylene tetrahydromethanopterin reductase-like flavin-dependent oxidoreductase (luciferase family)